MTDGVAAAAPAAAPATDSFSAGSGGLGVGSASSFDSALGSAALPGTLIGGTNLSSDLFSPTPLSTVAPSFGSTSFDPPASLLGSSTPSLFDPTPLAPGLTMGFSSPFDFSSTQPGAFTSLSSAFGPAPLTNASTETPNLFDRIGDRIGTNFDRMFSSPLGPGQEYQDFVAPFTQPTGNWTDNLTWPFQMFNRAALLGVPAAFDGAGRLIGATYHSAVDAGVETAVTLGMDRSSAERLGRDIHAMPEAFAGMPGALMPMRAGAVRTPGAWQAVDESMSARAAAYQAQITGRPGEAYIVGGVRFDGLDARGLIDAKGPGYATFVRDGEFRSWFTGADDLVAQAQRQLNVAGGQPVTWHVAEAEAATAIRNLLQERGIQGISVVHTPANP
jgi:Restriction endonuclease fold toxin 5